MIMTVIGISESPSVFKEGARAASSIRKVLLSASGRFRIPLLAHPSPAVALGAVA